MDTVYWISLIVGGVVVALSMLGGGDADMDADVDADFDADMDADSAIGAGAGLVDLLSLRTVFLFAAFFGLTGVLLPLTGVEEVTRLFTSIVLGGAIGIGGNFLIKRVGYDHVSSAVTSADLKGRSGNVLVPFESTDAGKIVVYSNGRRLQLMARAFEGVGEEFDEGDEVVVVRLNGAVAEVVKPT